MRAKWIITSLVASCIAAVAARGQGPVITSFKPNGELTWTNAVIGGEYDVEWTCSLGGPWNDSWESITGIVASDTTMTVNVPMFRGSLLLNAGAGSPTAPWTSGGPDSVYINDLAVDPTSPDTVFAAIDGEHLAKTTNGGASWDYVDNSPTDLGAVTIDPQEPPTMYAGAAYREWPANIVFAIRKGTEGGQSWARLGNMFTAWGYHDFGVSDIYVHPRDSNTILVALAGFGGENHPGGVHKTTDGGQTWERTYGFWANTLAAHPHDPDIVYFGTARWGYVFQSTDAGSTWQDFSPGGEWVWEVRDIEVDSNSHVYAATSEGLRKCDGLDGSNWAKLTGLPTDDITALAIDRSTSPGIVYAGTAGGVFVSEDGGNTWLPFMDGLGNVTISDLALTEGQSKILYAGTAGGVWSRPACAQATHTIFYRVARVPDPNPPVITLLGDNPMALELGTEYIEPGFSATDDIDGDITEWVVVTGSVDRTVPGTYTLRYSVADSGGNPAVERTRAVNVVDNSASPEGMRHIPAGSFQMGDNYDEGETDDVPLHAVDVDAFYMDKYEVTKALWDEVYDWAVANGYSFDNPGSGKGADHPVHTINWYDAVKWCNARSEKQGLTPVYYTSSAMTTVYRSGQLDLSNDCVRWAANGYRLPTEAEWEKAARGGLIGHHFPWESEGGSYTDHIDGSKANYADSGDPYESGDEPWTTPVGYYDGNQTPAGEDMANGYGLYDMAGNVYDLCWDWYQEDWYSRPGATENDTRGPDTGTVRAGRGGCWWHSHVSSTLWVLRCAGRDWGEPSDVWYGVGFRCVRSL